jgi:hypothetical protein
MKRACDFSVAREIGQTAPDRAPGVADAGVERSGAA